MTESRDIVEILFYIFRLALEWLFVINLYQLGYLSSEVKRDIFAQAQQLVKHHMRDLVHRVDNVDGGIRSCILQDEKRN